jgi:hypothetical protein
MGCQNSRPVSTRYPQQTFTQSKYDHFFGYDLDSNSSEVTDDSAKNFQQVLYTSCQEEGFGHAVRHDLRNCKAQDIYAYSLNLLRWTEDWEDWEDGTETENFVIKKRHVSSR